MYSGITLKTVNVLQQCLAVSVAERLKTGKIQTNKVIFNITAKTPVGIFNMCSI